MISESGDILLSVSPYAIVAFAASIQIDSVKKHHTKRNEEECKGNYISYVAILETIYKEIKG